MLAKRKYGASAKSSVKKEMQRFKKGTAKSGKAKTPVKNKKQAVAIGLSKARQGAKVPAKSR